MPLPGEGRRHGLRHGRRQLAVGRRAPRGNSVRRNVRPDGPFCRYSIRDGHSLRRPTETAVSTSNLLVPEARTGVEARLDRGDTSEFRMRAWLRDGMDADLTVALGGR